MDDNPYQSGNAPPGPLPAKQVETKHYVYKGTYGLAVGIACFVLPLCMCYVAVSALDTLGWLSFPTYTDPDAAVSSGLETTLVYCGVVIGVGSIGLSLVTGILTCMFMYRANANLRSFGAVGMEFTPGWCAGYWFIPIINLFRPYQAMKEIEKCSQSPEDISWMSNTPSGLLLPWWWAWIIGGVISRVELRLSMRIDMGIAAIYLSWAGTLILLLAGILLVRIVFRIQANQDAFLQRQYKQAGLEANLADPLH